MGGVKVENLKHEEVGWWWWETAAWGQWLTENRGRILEPGMLAAEPLLLEMGWLSANMGRKGRECGGQRGAGCGKGG